MVSLNSIKRIINRTGDLVSLLILIMVALPTIEAIIMRSLLNHPTIWTQELTTLVFGAYFMLGGAFCQSVKGHVAMDLIYNRLSGKWRAAADILIFLSIFIFCGVLFLFGGKLAWEATLAAERSESLWHPIIWPVRWAIPIGSGLLILQSFVDFIENIRTSLGRKGDVA